MAKWAFDFLEIEVTKDKKAIKKAYAALVKKYHPEEQPAQWEKAHEAYEAAMKYAESDEVLTNVQKWEESWQNEPVSVEQPEMVEEEVQADSSYGDLFQQAQSQWQQEKTEHEKALSYRMYELMRMKNNNAYAEWAQFFSTEFLPDEGIDSMMLLYEIVRAYPLQNNIIGLIVETMKKRAQYYQSVMELDKAALAADIVEAAQAQLPKQYGGNTGHHVKKRNVFPVMIGIAGIFAAIVLGVGLLTGKSNSLAREAKAQGLVYLNEKYEEKGYTEEELKAEKETLYGKQADKMFVYRIIEVESYTTIAYGLAKKGRRSFCFSIICREQRFGKHFKKESMRGLDIRKEGCIGIREVVMTVEKYEMVFSTQVLRVISMNL